MKCCMKVMNAVKELAQKQQGNLQSVEMHIDAAFKNIDGALEE